MAWKGNHIPYIRLGCNDLNHTLFKETFNYTMKETATKMNKLIGGLYYAYNYLCISLAY